MSSYVNCPNPECQGLISPDAIHASPMKAVLPAHQIYKEYKRTVLVWCETCRRAFEIIETTPGLPRVKSWHQDTHPLEVAKIRRRIAIANGTAVPVETPHVNCWA